MLIILATKNAKTENSPGSSDKKHLQIIFKTTSRWNARWRSEPSCRQTRQMVPEHNPILTQFLLSQSRVNSSLLTQFITGHNYLKYHRSLADPSVGRVCRLCNSGTEDSWHLLAQYEALAMHSYATFLDNNIRKLPHPKLVLQYIRQMRVIDLMEPPEEAVGLGQAEDNVGNPDEDRA